LNASFCTRSVIADLGVVPIWFISHPRAWLFVSYAQHPYAVFIAILSCANSGSSLALRYLLLWIANFSPCIFFLGTLADPNVFSFAYIKSWKVGGCGCADASCNSGCPYCTIRNLDTWEAPVLSFFSLFFVSLLSQIASVRSMRVAKTYGLPMVFPSPHKNLLISRSSRNT